MKNNLIVIEGMDGSGKATQSRILFQKLTDMNQKTRQITFPNYQSDSSALVKMYLNGSFGDDPEVVNAYAASSFYAVDRFASYHLDWKEDYLNGSVIIADRYVSSNLIYQLEKISSDKKNDFIHWVLDYEFCKLGLPRPGLVIYLDVLPEISQKLLSVRYDGDEGRKDIHEKNQRFLERCRENALYCAEMLGWKVVKCYDDHQIRDKDEISHEVIRISLDYLKKEEEY